MKLPRPKFKADDVVIVFNQSYVVSNESPIWNGLTYMYSFNNSSMSCGESYLTLVKGFKIEPYSDFDKSFVVADENLSMNVDYDDVDHDSVDCAVSAMVQVLNHHYAEYLAAYNLNLKNKENETENFARKILRDNCSR